MNDAGQICAFLSSVTWALGSAAYSKISQEHSPFAVNFTRAAIAFPVSFTLVFVMAGGFGSGLEEFLQLAPTHFGWYFLSTIASYGLGDVLFLWSTRDLGVPAALAIGSCYPLWTALWGVFVEGDSLALHQTAGLLLTVAGVIVVILNSSRGNSPSGPAPNRRDLLKRTIEIFRVQGKPLLLAVATSLFWSLNSIGVARGSHGITTAVANSARMALAMGFCGLLGIGWRTSPRFMICLPWNTVRKWIWAISFETIGGSFFFMYGMAHSKLAVGAALTALAPVLSVPVSLAIGVEKFSLPKTVGIIFVVLGLFFLVSE